MVRVGSRNATQPPQALVPHPSSLLAPSCTHHICAYAAVGVSHRVRAAIKEHHHHIMLNSHSVFDKGYLDMLMNRE